MTIQQAINVLNDGIFSSDPNEYMANVLAFERSISSKESSNPLIKKRIRETKKNLENIKSGRIYRGGDIGWVVSLIRESQEGIANYSNSLSFAKGYSDIVLEFEYHFSPERVVIETIADRKDTVSEYDEEIQQIDKD